MRRRRLSIELVRLTATAFNLVESIYRCSKVLLVSGSCSPRLNGLASVNSNVADFRHVRHTEAGHILVIAMSSLPSRMKSICRPIVSTLIPTLPIAYAVCSLSIPVAPSWTCGHLPCLGRSDYRWVVKQRQYGLSIPVSRIVADILGWCRIDLPGSPAASIESVSWVCPRHQPTK